MNCLFVLVLLCCCQKNGCSHWGRGNGCCSPMVCKNEQGSGRKDCGHEHRDRGCRENREERSMPDCGCMNRKEERSMPDCGCMNRKEERSMPDCGCKSREEQCSARRTENKCSCSMEKDRMPRYDGTIRCGQFGDTVPEMTRNMSNHCMHCQEDCGCNN